MDNNFALQFAIMLAHGMTREDLINKLHEATIAYKANPTDENFLNVSRTASLVQIKIQTDHYGYEKALKMFKDGSQAMDAFEIHKKHQS